MDGNGDRMRSDHGNGQGSASDDRGTNVSSERNGDQSQSEPNESSDSTGEAEIDQVRQQLEEQPERAGETNSTESTADETSTVESEADSITAESPSTQSGGPETTGSAPGDHHEGDLSTMGLAVVTVSTTRTLADDPSGDYIVQAMVEAGHDVVTRELIPDTYDDVQHVVDTLVDRADVDTVVTTGGTGVAPEDKTIEAIRPLFEKELPGFGELFRQLSREQIGSMVVATRATAGIVDGVPVFCLPGSTDAVQLGLDEIVVDVAPHLAGLARPPAQESNGNDVDEPPENLDTG